jgi:hypothetical protein
MKCTQILVESDSDGGLATKSHMKRNIMSDHQSRDTRNDRQHGTMGLVPEASRTHMPCFPNRRAQLQHRVPGWPLGLPRP